MSVQLDGDAIAWAAESVDTAIVRLASGARMNFADDYVFDSVDYVTGGAINVDFDDGQFSVGAGFDGLAYDGRSRSVKPASRRSAGLAGNFFDSA